MIAADLPLCCALAMACKQMVVLPLDSFPLISVTRPKGMPPTPVISSSMGQPVESDFTSRTRFSPRRMIVPSPHLALMPSSVLSRLVILPSLLGGRRGQLYGQPLLARGRHASHHAQNRPDAPYRQRLLPAAFWRRRK